LDDPLHSERTRGVIGNEGASGWQSFARGVSSDEVSQALLDRESCSLIRDAAIVSHE